MKLPTKRGLFKVYLNTGAVMTVRAADMEVDFLKENYEVHKYSFSGCDNRNRPVFLNPSQIVGIELVRRGYFV